MLFLLTVALLQAGPTPCPTASRPAEPPSLVVQAVDSTWLPLPGMQVTVTPGKAGGVRHTGTTEKNGFAEFWLPRQAEYSVEVESPGFKRKRVKGVTIGPVLEYTSTAYVQVQLRVENPKTTID